MNRLMKVFKMTSARMFDFWRENSKSNYDISEDVFLTKKVQNVNFHKFVLFEPSNVVKSGQD